MGLTYDYSTGTYGGYQSPSQKKKAEQSPPSNSGSGGGKSQPSANDLFQAKLKQESILNEQGQIKADKLQRYRELYNQYIKKPGDYETYKREGFVPGTSEEQAYNTLQDTEQAYINREIERNPDKVVVLGSPGLNQSQAQQIAQYTKLYGRPALSNNPDGSIQATYYRTETREYPRQQEEEILPQTETAGNVYNNNLSGGFYGNQNIRQTRTDLKPGFFETFPQADFSSQYFGSIEEDTDNPFKADTLELEKGQGYKVEEKAVQFQESVNALKTEEGVFNRIKYTFEAGEGAVSYLQGSVTLGAFRFGGNIINAVTKPGETAINVIKGTGRFVAVPSERVEVLKKTGEKFVNNPIAYVTEAGLNVLGPDVIIKGVKGLRGSVREARFNRQIDASNTILTDPRRLDYLREGVDVIQYKPGSGTLTEPNKLYIQYEPGVQTNLYGQTIPDQVLINQVKPGVAPEGPLLKGPYKENFYSQYEDTIIKPVRDLPDQGVYNKDIQQPLLNQKFSVYDRVTGYTYKNLPGDSQIIQDYFKGVRAFDDPVNFGKPAPEGVPRYNLIPETLPPNSKTFLQQSVLKNYQDGGLIKPGPKGTSDLILTGETLNLKYYDPVADTIPPKPPVQATTDLNKLVYTSVPGAESIAKGINKGVDFVADLSQKAKSINTGSASVLSEPGAGVRSVGLTQVSISPAVGFSFAGSVNSYSQEKELSNFNVGKIAVKQEDEQASLFKPGYKLTADVKSKSVSIYEQKLKQEEDYKVLVVPAYKTATKTITEQELIQDKVTETEQIIKPVPPVPDPGEGGGEFIYNPRETGRIKPPVPPRKEEPSPFYSRTRGFVAVGIKGQLLSPVLSREGALNYGAGVVDRTALRSFKIKEVTGSPINLNVEGGYNPDKFYKSKKGFFTEKSRFAIDTPGEYGEISFKGLLIKGNKNKRNVFNKKFKGGNNGIF